MYFNPEKKLYKIEVTWGDAGKTYNTLKDALDSKYGNSKRSGSGFKTTYTYLSGVDIVELTRNSFGFGDRQTTSLSYTNPKLEYSAIKMKAKINEHIRKNNAKNAGSDL